MNGFHECMDDVMCFLRCVYADVNDGWTGEAAKRIFIAPVSFNSLSGFIPYINRWL